jgi:hypothetical protein
MQGSLFTQDILCEWNCPNGYPWSQDDAADILDTLPIASE